MADLAKRVLDIKQKIRQAELKTVEYETKLQSAREKMTELNKKCLEHGVRPNQLKDHLKELEQKILALVGEIEENLNRIKIP